MSVARARPQYGTAPIPTETCCPITCDKECCESGARRAPLHFATPSPVLWFGDRIIADFPLWSPPPPCVRARLPLTPHSVTRGGVRQVRARVRSAVLTAGVGAGQKLDGNNACRSGSAPLRVCFLPISAVAAAGAAVARVGRPCVSSTTPSIVRAARSHNAGGCCGHAANRRIDDIGFARVRALPYPHSLLILQGNTPIPF